MEAFGSAEEMRPTYLLLSCLSLAGGLVGCKPPPPNAWAQGGAYLEIPRARWVLGSLLVDMDWDGRVRVGGEHWLTVDRAGRAFTPGGTPIALLLPDGRLLGPGDDGLGIVGVATAARGQETTAWLQVSDSGEVVRFGERGPRPFGVWMGCAELRARRACTLVTHLFALEHDRAEAGPAPAVPVRFGVGIGVGL